MLQQFLRFSEFIEFNESSASLSKTLNNNLMTNAELT